MNTIIVMLKRTSTASSRQRICFLKNVAILLLISSSFFSVKVHAQTSFLFTVDTTPITYQIGQLVKWDTAYGSLKNLTQDSLFLSVTQTFAPPWNVRARVSDSSITASHVTNKIGLASNEMLSLLVLFLPYPPGRDTNVCFTVRSLRDSNDKQELCIPLYILPATNVSQDESLSVSCRIYPNPFSTLTTIALTAEQATQRIIVKIHNISGVEMTSSFVVKGSANNVIISRLNAPTGIYYYHILSASQPSSIVGSGKFVIQ